MVLQKASRFRTEVARPRIGPGAALGFPIADRLAGFACRIGRHLEIAIITAGTVDGKFPHAVARLDDAGAAHAGCGAAVFHSGRHLAFEPAHRRTIGGRVVEAPGSAAAFAVTPGRACGRIAGSYRKARKVAAATVEPHLRTGCRRDAQDNSNRQRQRNKSSNHLVPWLFGPAPEPAPPPADVRELQALKRGPPRPNSPPRFDAPHAFRRCLPHPSPLRSRSARVGATCSSHKSLHMVNNPRLPWFRKAPSRKQGR
jgi:hypothetical protein